MKKPTSQPRPARKRPPRKHPDAPPPLERAALIADLMARGQYRTHITATELSKQWGLAYGTVVNDACAAAKILRVSDDQIEDWRTRLAFHFEALSDEARCTINEATGLPDWGSAIRALDLMGKYLGLEPKTEIAHSGSVTLESLDSIRERIQEAREKS